MRSQPLLAGILLVAMLAPSAPAQSLLALDNGDPVATSSLVNEFLYNCTPNGRCPTHGLFGPSIPSPFGGIAYNWLDGTVWVTDGLELVQMDRSCGLLQRCPTGASVGSRWTGLAIDPLNNLLFYTTPANDILSVPATCPLNRSTLICSMAPGGGTLTGVEYDDSDGGLWVCDDMGTVSKVAGSSPSSGCLVRQSFRARCPNAVLVPPIQGITLDVFGGKLFLTDSGNNLIVLDLAGNPLHCCALPSQGSRINQVGLARVPAPVSHSGRGCSGRLCPGCSPILRETSDAHIPNPHFALEVSEGPVGGSAFFLFSGGGGNVTIPSLCGPFRVDLVPPPIVIGPLGLTSPSGNPCSGKATLTVPIPLDPVLYGATVYSQVFGLCGMMGGIGHFLSDGAAITLS